LADDPGRFLSTIQIGITLVGVINGAFGGTLLAVPLSAFLNQFNIIGPYSNSIALAIVVISITYLSLVFGELVPKRIALNNPERAALMVARPMATISRLASPPHVL